MYFPAHNLAAEDVNDQVEIEEHASDRSRHPGNVPGPDLTGRASLIACGRFAPDRRLGTPPMLLLPVRTQNTVKAGFRGQIAPPIGQFRHNLAWGKARELLRITDI